jgi:hypothetical protein
VGTICAPRPADARSAENLLKKLFNAKLTHYFFSKKVENQVAMVALHFKYYNYCRINQTLRVMPAMACGLSREVWEIEDLPNLIDQKFR